jgi:esterase/lipase superfamily enzyme
VSREAWLDDEAHPGHKAWIQGRFDRYLHDELLPFIRRDCNGYDRVWAAGASLGAFNAVLAGARDPGAFEGIVAMSGTYTMDRWMHGHMDEAYYLCQPMRFLPNMAGPPLDALQRTRFLIASGTGKWEAPAESEALAALLQNKGAQCDLQLWGTDADHDWPTWRSMLPLFLDRLLP